MHQKRTQNEVKLKRFFKSQKNALQEPLGAVLGRSWTAPIAQIVLWPTRRSFFQKMICSKNWWGSGRIEDAGGESPAASLVGLLPCFFILLFVHYSLIMQTKASKSDVTASWDDFGVSWGVLGASWGVWAPPRSSERPKVCRIRGKVRFLRKTAPRPKEKQKIDFFLRPLPPEEPRSREPRASRVRQKKIFFMFFKRFPTPKLPFLGNTHIPAGNSLIFYGVRRAVLEGETKFH